MTKVLVIYTTTMGSTRKMAQAVADGARSVTNTAVVLLEAAEAMKDERALEQLKNETRRADAILMGTPMRHRSADARIKKYIEDVIEQLWLMDEMVGKVGGVFSVGGGYGNTGAGCEIAQLGMLAAMAGAGMLLVSLPKTTPGAEVAGSHWGPHGRSGGLGMEPIGITDEMITCGFHHGANVARVAFALNGQDLFARGNVAPSAEVLKMFANTQPTTE